MRPFFVSAVCLMVSVFILAYSGVHESGIHEDEGSGKKYSSAAIENLNFRVTGGGEKFRVITADFDVVSGEESNGEIKIMIDGRQLVNNRLIVKSGDSHYSLDFIIHDPDIQNNERLYSATANLVINGSTNDSKQQAFMLNYSALAGNSRYSK